MKTYKGEKIEFDEQELRNRLAKAVEYMKKDHCSDPTESFGTEVAFLGNYGLFTKTLIEEFRDVFEMYVKKNFRHQFVFPYIIGTRDNFEILTHNAEVFNKNGLKAERT